MLTPRAFAKTLLIRIIFLSLWHCFFYEPVQNITECAIPFNSPLDNKCNRFFFTSSHSIFMHNFLKKQLYFSRDQSNFSWFRCNLFGLGLPSSLAFHNWVLLYLCAYVKYIFYIDSFGFSALILYRVHKIVWRFFRLIYIGSKLGSLKDILKNR